MDVFVKTPITTFGSTVLGSRQVGNSFVLFRTLDFLWERQKTLEFKDTH